MKIPPTTPEPPLLKKYTNLQGAEQSLTNALLVLAGMGFLALIGLLLFLCWKCITRKRKSKHPQHYRNGTLITEKLNQLSVVGLFF